ncbi:AraC family transcriptional regulator [Streptomyces bauhiniae]|uniref:AraC family transcriptional regulator n=1 Tax=Streptomyces bauhiniae TaxID=2340725 RepID=A0A7K3QVK4_9ACTN|nr:AraC family transcriptional regulator [Streptomyces bauhiniae]NEB93906.1 AraC family transcriptional regulator [Streptomyces bauhiniae]
MDRLLDIKNAITRHAHEGLTATALPGLSVLRTTRTTQPSGDVLEPAFALIAGGLKHTALNGEVYEYGPGEYLVATVDLPVVGNIVTADEDDPFMAVTLRLKPDRIASLLLDTGGPHRPASAHSLSAFGVGHASAHLLDAIARLLALLDHPADLAALGAGVEREVLWRLLTGPQGASIRQIGIADSRLAHLTRAVRWIRDHYTQPLRVPDLATTAAMSPSVFHRHFLTLTSMTPLEYQKQLRLNEARMRLLTGHHDIAEVGFSVGYSSPSQFSREYRRMFGAPPSQTAPAPHRKMS